MCTLDHLECCKCAYSAQSAHLRFYFKSANEISVNSHWTKANCCSQQECIRWAPLALLNAYVHCKDTIPKFETNNPRKRIAPPQSQFPHSYVCERFIYSHDRSAYSAAGKYVDQSWEYINRSQTHECVNWDWRRAIPFLGIHTWDFRFSVHPVSASAC